MSWWWTVMVKVGREVIVNLGWVRKTCFHFRKPRNVYSSCD